MNPMKLLPLVSKLGEYLKLGVDHYVMLKAAGPDAGPDVVAAFLLVKMEGWDPQLNGKRLLDAETRQAAARFLAGVAVNFVGA